MGLKDFTPKQAEQWVQQEFAKSTTAAAATKRIDDERKMLEFISTSGLPDMPNSRAAHEKLIERLAEKFDIQTEAKPKFKNKP